MTRDYSYLIENKHATGQVPNKTTFKKGSTPWNKGKKGIHLSPKSEFKLGNNVKTSFPIGTITIRKSKNNGSRQHIKINLPSKWEEYAKYVWKQYYGKVLNGDIIHHLDGDTLNDSIENLIAIPRKDHPIFHNRWGLKPLTDEQIDFYISRYK